MSTRHLALALAVVLLVTSPLVAVAECMYCSRSDPNGGICNIVLTPSPSIATLSNCEGTLYCSSGADGSEICFPACNGNPCFWV